MLRRYQTGWRDGQYTLPSGHLNGNESVRQAAIREAKEEVSVDIDPDDLRFVCVIDRKADEGDHERVDFFFEVEKYKGKLINNEPHKCDEIGWFAVNKLPKNVVPPVLQALHAMEQGQYYTEQGW